MSSVDERKAAIQEQIFGRIDQLFETLTERVATVEAGKCLRTCVNCGYFDYTREKCRHTTALKRDPGGVRPPAKVIAFGCGQFEPDIPF